MSADTTCSAAEQDERVLNAEEQRERLKGFVTEAKQLQTLLKTYEHQQRSLEADVAAFVVKEIEEQQTMKEIREEILRRERGSLQNMEYVRFTRDHKEDSVGFAEMAPTQRMRHHDNSISNGEEEVTATGARQMGSLACSVLTALKASDSPLASWCPDSVADLPRYGDLKEVLLGWRVATPSTPDEVRALSRDAFDQSTNRLCCFVNGIMCVPDAIVGHDGAPQESLSEAVKVCTEPGATAEGVAARFALWLNAACAFSLDAFTAAATKAATPVARDGALSTLFASGLSGEAHDTMVFVDPARLAQTQPFRVFILGGEVVAVEHVGAPVDVLPMLTTGTTGMDRHALRECEKNRVSRTAEALYAEVRRCLEGAQASLASPRSSAGSQNVVLTMAVAPEPLSDTDKGTHTRGVLLDVCRLTPTLPFRWHLTWGEVCSLGQARRGEGSGSQHTVSPVTFKCSHVQAVYLEPFDPVTCAYYPVLNERLLGQTQLPTPPASHARAAHASEGSLGEAAKRADSVDRTALYVCGAAISAAALTVAALRVLGRNQ